MAKPKPKRKRGRAKLAKAPSPPRSMAELLEAARRVRAQCQETIHQLSALQERILMARERDEERYTI
jgi:hypothetical protein